jgi:hypothetical protein
MECRKEIGVGKKYACFLKKFFIGGAVDIIAIENSDLAVIILKHGSGNDIRKLCPQGIISRIGNTLSIAATFGAFDFSRYMVNVFIVGLKLIVTQFVLYYDKKYQAGRYSYGQAADINGSICLVPFNVSPCDADIVSDHKAPSDSPGWGKVVLHSRFFVNSRMQRLMNV